MTKIPPSFKQPKKKQTKEICFVWFNFTWELNFPFFHIFDLIGCRVVHVCLCVFFGFGLAKGQGFNFILKLFKTICNFWLIM